MHIPLLLPLVVAILPRSIKVHLLHHRGHAQAVAVGEIEIETETGIGTVEIRTRVVAVRAATVIKSDHVSLPKTHPNLTKNTGNNSSDST